MITDNFKFKLTLSQRKGKASLPDWTGMLWAGLPVSAGLWESGHPKR